MPESIDNPPRRARLPLSTLLIYWAYSLSFVLGIALMVYGTWERDRSLAIIGLIALAVVALGLPVTLFALRGSGGASGDSRSVVDAVERLMEHAALSDDARRVLNRRADRHLLRQAIEEDMHTGDHEAALVLVRELAERFGYRSDAEELRARIEAARFEAVEHRITEAIGRLDSLIAERRWDEAMTEAARITRTHPDSHRVEGLRKPLGADHAEEGVELVDGPVGLDPHVVLGDAPPSEEPRVAVVPGLGCDAHGSFRLPAIVSTRGGYVPFGPERGPRTGE